MVEEEEGRIRQGSYNCCPLDHQQVLGASSHWALVSHHMAQTGGTLLHRAFHGMVQEQSVPGGIAGSGSVGCMHLLVG